MTHQPNAFLIFLPLGIMGLLVSFIRVFERPDYRNRTASTRSTPGVRIRYHWLSPG